MPQFIETVSKDTWRGVWTLGRRWVFPVDAASLCVGMRLAFLCLILIGYAFAQYSLSFSTSAESAVVYEAGTGTTNPEFEASLAAPFAISWVTNDPPVLSFEWMNLDSQPATYLIQAQTLSGTTTSLSIAESGTLPDSTSTWELTIDDCLESDSLLVNVFVSQDTGLSSLALYFSTTCRLAGIVYDHLHTFNGYRLPRLHTWHVQYRLLDLRMRRPLVRRCL